jgi:hypothetical protein
MTLELLGNEYSVYRFDPDYKIDENILSGEFISVTRTRDELSIVAQQGKFSDFLNSEEGWKILKISGVLDFSLIGIMSKLSTILANENISVFVMSTYNTDYIMVKKDNVKKAIEILEKNGYEVRG